MKTDYYYGQQAEQYSFYRLPKLLMAKEEYADLSMLAKMLYGLMLDRMDASTRNKWFDDQGRVYVVFPILEAQKMLMVSKRKAMEYMAELESYGLIKRKHRGNGLPDLIYLMNVAL